jgi:hypothetical protein
VTWKTWIAGRMAPVPLNDQPRGWWKSTAINRQLLADVAKLGGHKD